MKKRILSIISIAGILAITCSLVATARTTGNLTTTGAKFTGINYSFDPWPCNSQCAGGKNSVMNFSGSLADTNTGDKNDVFVEAKIDGYGYAGKTYTSSSKRTVSVSKKIYKYDPAQSGKINLCRDRGILAPNNCTTSPTLYR